MRHIRLVVEYDGTELHGWQRQLGAATVQQHIEEALGKLLTHDVQITGASRTDAGVHARGQVASFRTERTIAVHGIRRGLNSMLPDSIAVRDASEVPEAFHPRFWATSKHYRYTILTRPERSPRWRHQAWHISEPLDVRRMAAAAQALIGEHDFSAFRAAGCTAKTTLRRVDSIMLTRLPDHLIEVDVRGNAFLRQMVRIIVGTLVDVGVGRTDESQVAKILTGKDRTKAGQTAPAQGLTLVEVRYDGPRPKPAAADV